MSRLLIASPHRYPDLARLWHRFVVRELAPEFSRLDLAVETNIFCDANADRFLPNLFRGVRFNRSGPGMRDFVEFYDATINAPYDFVLFLDADTFLLDGAWARSYFEALIDPRVAAVSLVPRRGAPAIFALLCRTESFRVLPAPALACRYEFPEDWPRGVNLQPGEFAFRELAKRGKTVINIDADESARHTVNFRGTTGIRTSREHTTRAVGEQVFLQSVSHSTGYLVAAYDNILLGYLYEALYREPFAPDSAGMALGGSLTEAEFERALREVRDGKQLAALRARFQLSHRDIVRLAEREGIELALPPVP